MDKINIKGFRIQELLELKPKDYYLKKSTLLQSGSDWMCVPFKTDFEEIVLITDYLTGNSIRTTTSLTEKSVTIDKDLSLFQLKFETDKQNLILKLTAFIKDFLKIDAEDYSLNQQILAHFKHGIILGKNKYISNIELMLEDLFVYLSNLPGDENVDMINQCNILIYAIRNIFDKKHFIYKPVFLSGKESRKYQKLHASIQCLLNKNGTFKNNMLEYCLILRNMYLTKSKKYHSFFVNYYKFFVSLGIELNSIYNKTNFFKSSATQVSFNNYNITYVSNESNSCLSVNLLIFILADIEYNGSKFELPYWKNRLFGKGYKLLCGYEYAMDINGNQPAEKYDIANFTEDFNKMIDQRIELNQKFHN